MLATLYHLSGSARLFERCEVLSIRHDLSMPELSQMVERLLKLLHLGSYQMIQSLT